LRGTPTRFRCSGGRARDPDDDFRTSGSRKACARERQAELVARTAPRHLIGHAVDLVALNGGEISWQWEDYFRVTAAMKAAAREFASSWHHLALSQIAWSSNL
jgi:hypothetical protein